MTVGIELKLIAADHVACRRESNVLHLVGGSDSGSIDA
jgi:hypothetical protein